MCSWSSVQHCCLLISGCLVDGILGSFLCSSGEGVQWHPTPVLLPGKSHGRRSLVGCSPWGQEDSDTTERLHFHFSLSCTGEGNGNPLQCSCLENPRDGGVWWAAVYGVAQSWTRLKRLSSSSLPFHQWEGQRWQTSRAGGILALPCAAWLVASHLTSLSLECKLERMSVTSLPAVLGMDGKRSAQCTFRESLSGVGYYFLRCA